MKRIDQLTVTRIAMVLLVVVYHGGATYYTAFLDFFPFSAILSSAPTAVSFLYVLSGFVMALVYFKPGERLDIAAFYRARFVRIYPLYIIAFILTCLYYYDGLFGIKPQKFLANIFVVQAWIPAYAQSFNYAAWSMTVEFFFYAVFPFFLLWAARQSSRKLAWTAMAFWGITQAIHFVLWKGYHPEYKDFIIYFPLFHLNSFILGSVGAIWYLRHGRGGSFDPKMVIGLMVISLLLIAGYTVVSSEIYPALPHDLETMTGLLAPIMTLFIVALSLDNSIISRVFRHPIPVNLGETAYAVYILHVPLSWLYESALWNLGLSNPQYIFDLTFLPLILMVGLFAHFVLDLRLRKWLNRFLQTITIRVLLFDLAVVLLTAFFIFKVRFPLWRDYQGYREMERLVIWLTFIILPAASLIIGSCRRTLLEKPLFQWSRVLLVSVTVGNALVAGIVYAVYRFGGFENFPRSIFLYVWLIVLSTSFLIRFVFSALKKEIPSPVIA